MAPKKIAQTVLTEGKFYTISAANGKVIEVADYNIDNGAKIQLMDNANFEWQQWNFVAAGDGVYRIQNRFTGKKDLAQIAMTNGHVYVAQVAMGANPAQTLRALKEAESYDGPSLIIAYAPCINHGLKAGMNRSMVEMKKAVRAGYWNLLRFDPRLAEEGKNPLQIDSAKPNEDYQSFLRGEVRYASLRMKNPEHADALFAESEKNALGRYESLIQRHNSLEPKEGLAR